MQAFCNLSASLHNSPNLTLFRFVLCPDFVEIWWKLANWSKRSFRRKYYRKEWDSYTLMLKCLYLTQGKSIQTKTLNFTRSFTVLVGCSEICLSVISEPFFLLQIFLHIEAIFDCMGQNTNTDIWQIYYKWKYKYSWQQEAIGCNSKGQKIQLHFFQVCIWVCWTQPRESLYFKSKHPYIISNEQCNIIKLTN